jgi:hypothetical protein
MWDFHFTRLTLRRPYSGGDRRSTRLLLVAALCVGLAACGGSGPESAATTTEAPATTTSAPAPAAVETTTSAAETPDDAEPPPVNSDDPWATTVPDADFEGALLGFSTGLSNAERAPRFRQIIEDAGRDYDIGHVFHRWDLPIPTADDLMHLEDGRLLMISWNGTDTRQIAAGDHDQWIRTQAEAVRDLDRRVLLRWLWEMDGNRRRDWVYSGPDYVAAWNHIRGIFDEVGATNAEFVWCPNEFLFWDGGDPEPWYPGDDNVDWLCADGYNWPNTTQSPEWVDFVDIFGDFYAWAAEKDLPIMIGETGVGEAEPGAKAEWIRSVPRLLESEMPEIDAVVWFDKDFTSFGHNDWRVDTSPDAYDAWIEISNDPYLNPLGR